MANVTKPMLDKLRSCNNLASHWVKDNELGSVIGAWLTVLALEITHAQLVV